jgi:curli production assembly/transport component CsgG|tara:strand:- start:108 stop:1094 length:987 start_codon:yes stop_codon:yes gene_type:complete
MIKFLIISSLILMSGCAGIPAYNATGCASILECREDAEIVKLPSHQELLNLPPAKVRPIVAVYSFDDKTGQRRRQDGVASFSTAVSQGAMEMLIDALKTAGNGTWFRVVERGGLDHLVRERQIVRSTRQDFAKDGEKAQVQPLLFAGMLIEGGIIGYDANTETGGMGARWLGVGATTQYRRDSVIVSLRAISTLTGEVLLNVQSKKTILSVGGGFDVFKFMDMDTQLLEIENGVSFNESVTYATRTAIEAAVLAMIQQGHERGFWEITQPQQDTGAMTDKGTNEEVGTEIAVKPSVYNEDKLFDSRWTGKILRSPTKDPEPKGDQNGE